MKKEQLQNMQKFIEKDIDFSSHLRAEEEPKLKITKLERKFIDIAKIIYSSLLTKNPVKEGSVKIKIEGLTKTDEEAELVLATLESYFNIYNISISQLTDFAFDIYYQNGYLFDTTTHQVLCEADSYTWGGLNYDAKFALIRAIINKHF